MSALTVALSAGALLTASAGWTVDSGAVVVVCPLTVGGSFEAKTTALTGSLAADAGNPSAVTGSLAVDLATLDTGIGLRNTHMRERYLEVGKGDGFDRAVLSEIVLTGTEAATAAGRVPFTARLTVHGVTQPVSGTATIGRTGGQIQVDATFPVNLPAFQVPKPRYLGVGVQDDVQVRVKFSAAAAAATGHH